MTDCVNEEMQDLLPELAHGSLAAAESERVRAHVATCAACAAELTVLGTSRLVLQAGAPRVDVAAIAAAVARATATATAAAPALRVERGGATSAVTARRSIWRSRQLLAAAASLLIVASLSLRLLDRTPATDEGPASPDTVAAAIQAPVPTYSAAGGGISVGDALVDLTSDDLTKLLDELDRVDATITLEPTSVRQPIVDVPEIP